VEVSEHNHEAGEESSHKHGKKRAHNRAHKHGGKKDNENGGEERNPSAKEFMDVIDKADGFRKRGKLIVKFIDENNLLLKFFDRLMREAGISDSDHQVFDEVMKSIDDKNLIRKRLKVIAEYMDKNNVLKTVLHNAYDGKQSLSSEEKAEIKKLFSQDTATIKARLNEKLQSANEKIKEHSHGDVSFNDMAEKIDNGNQLRKILKLLITIIDDNNLLQKFFSTIMKEAGIEKGQRKIFKNVLKTFDKKDAIRAELKIIAEMLDKKNSLRKFAKITFDQSQSGEFSLSAKAKKLITKIFTGKKGFTGKQEISKESAEG